MGEIIDYQIAVMQAYKEGKKIECLDIHNPKDKWEEVTPFWNWQDFDYRVKKESNYRPYKNAEEFLQAQKDHGIFLKNEYDIFRLPVRITADSIDVVFTDSDLNSKFSFKDLLELFTWQDGTPCGITDN